ncbi:MAG: hypothetical protein H6732_06615 [Alphaproteobacteria bacterium]|nr:hypothetical protein [Alphaproteobacteria bacterium]
MGERGGFRRAVATALLVLACVAPRGAHAGDVLRCAVVMELVDATPLAQLIQLVEAREVDERLVRCLERRGAPAPLVEAARSRLAGVEAVPRTVVPLDLSRPDWPEEAGRALAAATRARLPVERPVALVQDPGAPAPFWLFERLDRALAACLDALPRGSQAAEAPSVLGDDGLLLLDPDARAEPDERLQRMGFREVVVVRWSQQRAGEASLEVREIGGRTRYAKLTLAPSGVEDLTLEATPPRAAPGREVDLVARVAGDSDGLTLLVRDGPRVVGTMVPQGGSTWTLSVRMPHGDEPTWTLEAVASTADGPVGSALVTVVRRGVVDAAAAVVEEEVDPGIASLRERFRRPRRVVIQAQGGWANYGIFQFAVAGLDLQVRVAGGVHVTAGFDALFVSRCTDTAPELGETDNPACGDGLTTRTDTLFEPRVGFVYRWPLGRAQPYVGVDGFLVPIRSGTTGGLGGGAHVRGGVDIFLVPGFGVGVDVGLGVLYGSAWPQVDARLGVIGFHPRIGAGVVGAF